MKVILLSIWNYALVIINSQKNDHIVRRRRKQLQTNLVLQNDKKFGHWILKQQKWYSKSKKEDMHF